MALSDLATRAGGGDHAAFRALYASLGPRTLAAALHDPPEPAQAVQVLYATFCELWWMCAVNVRRSTGHGDVREWIGGITARRATERRH
jgi:hypothetical protein